jgi:hypothetical protein
MCVVKNMNENERQKNNRSQGTLKSPWEVKMVIRTCALIKDQEVRLKIVTLKNIRTKNAISFLLRILQKDLRYTCWAVARSLGMLRVGRAMKPVFSGMTKKGISGV